MLTPRGVLVVASCLMVLGCGGSPPRFHLPTSPTEASTPPPVYVPPPPRQWPPYEITTIAVGDVINRTNLDAPECLDELGWPCLYFRIIPPSTGTLEVTLSWAAGTQGAQAVDLTVSEAGTHKYVWAQSYQPGPTRSEGRVTAPVIGDTAYDITLWYTFPNLAYEIQARMR